MAQFHLCKSERPHPLIMATAASLITFTLLGVGAVTGLIPSAYSGNSGDTQKTRFSGERSFSGQDATRRSVAQSACANCGVVDAIRAVQVDGNASGLGAVVGGVTGAVVGHQIGNGHGRDAMTVIGGVGGAFAGHPIEKNISRHTVYRVTVHMDDGSFRTVSQSHEPAVAIGSKVRVANGSLVALS